MSSDPRAPRPIADELGTLAALLRIPLDALTAHNYARLERLGFPDVRPAHSAVLRYLPYEGARVTRLAAQARMSKQSMAELVEYLRGRGYVDVVADATDARAKLVRLTRRGLTLVGAIVESTRLYEARCAKRLGPRKWTQLRAHLAELASVAAAAPDKGKSRDRTALSSRRRSRGRARR